MGLGLRFVEEDPVQALERALQDQARAGERMARGEVDGAEQALAGGQAALDEARAILARYREAVEQYPGKRQALVEGPAGWPRAGRPGTCWISAGRPLRPGGLGRCPRPARGLGGPGAAGAGGPGGGGAFCAAGGAAAPAGLPAAERTAGGAGGPAGAGGAADDPSRPAGRRGGGSAREKLPGPSGSGRRRGSWSPARGLPCPGTSPSGPIGSRWRCTVRAACWRAASGREPGGPGRPPPCWSWRPACARPSRNWPGGRERPGAPPAGPGPRQPPGPGPQPVQPGRGRGPAAGSGRG